MKLTCIIGLYAIFTASLIAGFNSGSNIGSGANAIGDAYSTPMASSQGTQHNLLLIQVDRLGSDQPRLEGVWLMAFYTNTPRVDLLPIYPSEQTSLVEKVQNLPEVFKLTHSGEPDESFWLEMQAVDTWWNAYLMLDDQALQTLEEVLSTDTAGSDLNPSWEVNSPVGDISPYQGVCRTFEKYQGNAGFYRIYLAVKGQTRSNLKPGELKDIWQLLRSYGTNLNCSYPTLQPSIPQS
jgi:hypothetical protein